MDLSPVTYMDPYVLAAALNGTVDRFDVTCPYDECEDAYDCENPDHFEAVFSDLMAYKLDECSEEFISSIINEGARNPICVQIREGEDGEVRWVHGNGHHRTAVYLDARMTRLPVVFAFDGDYMHSKVTGDFEEKADSTEH